MPPRIVSQSAKHLAAARVATPLFPRNNSRSGCDFTSGGDQGKSLRNTLNLTVSSFWNVLAYEF
jgi:hypothetical protein